MIPGDVDDRDARRLAELLRPRMYRGNAGMLVGDVSRDNNEIRMFRTDRIDGTPRGRGWVAQMGVAQLNDSPSVPLDGQPGNRYVDTAYEKHMRLDDHSVQQQCSNQGQHPEQAPVSVGRHRGGDSSSLHDVSVINVNSGRHMNRTGRWLMPIPALT